MRAALVLLACGCAAQSPQLSTRTPEGGRHARFGWVAWDAPDTLITCNRRVDDHGTTLGVLGPCARIRPNLPRQALVSWLNINRPDTTPADAAPWKTCSLRLEDAQLGPTPSPARLWLVTPSGRRELAAWTPEARLTADVFKMEATFSPDGPWLGIVHLAIGLGEGERVIEIPIAQVIPLPDCP